MKYEEMKVKELQQECKKRKMKISSKSIKFSKRELIEQLKSCDEVQVDNQEVEPNIDPNRLLFLLDNLTKGAEVVIKRSTGDYVIGTVTSILDGGKAVGCRLHSNNVNIAFPVASIKWLKSDKDYPPHILSLLNGSEFKGYRKQV